MDQPDRLTQAEWTRRAHAALLAACLLEDPQASRPATTKQTRATLAAALAQLERMAEANEQDAQRIAFEATR